MKKIFLSLFAVMAIIMKVYGVEPPDGTFSWGIPVPLQIDYLASETLSVTSSTIQQFNVTYELLDPTKAQYIGINGNIVTVLNNYDGDDEQTQGRIYIKAVISGMSGYDDTELVTYIETRRIVPMLRWNCTLGDMIYGSSVKLSVIHGNTDNPDINVTYTASDNVSSPSDKVSIDQTNGMMTAVNPGNGIYVTAKIDSTANYKATSITYLRDDSIIRFNVIKGNRPITWDGTDFSNLTNLSEGTELHTQYLENQDSVFYSTSDFTVAEIVNGNYLKINGPGRVTVTALVKESGHYFQSQSDTVIDISLVNTTVFWEEGVVEGQKQVMTSTLKDYNLNILANSNYINGTSFHFSSSDTAVAKVSGDTLLTCYKIGSFRLSVYATNDVGGQSSTITRDIDVTRGYMRFVRNGKWNDRNNWERSDIDPDGEDYNVEMLAKCTIPDGQTARCYNLDIYTQGGIVIEPGGTMYVTNRLENNAGEKQLCLKADKRKQAAVYFKEGNPMAEVNVWMNVSSANAKDTLWEYIGIPVDTAYMKILDGNKKVYEYDEGTGLTDISSMMTQLKAWHTYRITDSLPSYYTFVGRLNPGTDHKFELGYSNGKNPGMNVIVNSYSAPIDLRAMEFEGVPEELHYPAGLQWAVAPKYTARAAGSRNTLLPAEAMFVQTESTGAGITMDYDKAMTGDFAGDEDFNILRIAISGAKYSDTVALIGCASGSEAFDNGYDGTKWLGPDSLPQIFASNEWGRASVNASQSIVGQNIGVIAANDIDLYRITFDTKRLKDYDQLYLFDMNTQAYVDIIAGETYTFSTTRLGEEQRFTIVRDKIEGKKDKDGRGFVVIGKKVLLIGFGTEHALVRVLNAAGIVVHEFWSDEGPWVELPELMNGIYIINSGQSYTKFYR